MAKDLNELLGYRTLTGIIQATVPGVPDILPASFDSFSKQVLMDEGEYTVTQGNRGVARRVKFGAPAQKRNLNKVGIQPVKLLHWKEEFELEAKVMMKLRAMDSYTQDTAYEQVTAQIAFFNEYFTNNRKTIKFKTLYSPTLYFDGDGNLLPSSSGAVETVTLYSRSASNTGQGLQMDGSTAILGATWSSASTDIPKHLRILKKTALARTGYPIKHIIYGENVLSNLIQNNFVKDYLAREGKQRGEYLNEDEIGHLFGLDWIPGYTQFWNSNVNESNETSNFIMGADDIIALPEPNRNWWERLDGSFPVPTNINIQTDIESAFKSIHLEHGKFAFSYVDLQKLSAVCTCGDTFLYALKVPDATYVLDTAF